MMMSQFQSNLIFEPISKDTPFLEFVKAKLLLLKLIHLFAREVLLVQKLEIEKTKPTFIISVLKVEY